MSIPVPLEGFGGGGGTSLNFDLKGYATEELLLAATPKENTIGVITTTTITSWIFGATEPTEPAEGMVWVTVGTSSTVEFNALKKNAIQVYPISAKQYVNGAWVSVYAYSFQDGEWVEFSSAKYYLFKSSEGAKVTFSKSTESNASITIGTDNIKISYSDETDCYSVMQAQTDLTDFSVLSALCTVTDFFDDYDDSIFFVSKSKLPLAGDFPSTAASAIVTKGDHTSNPISIDISSLSGTYYVGFWGAANLTINNWYLG